MGRDERGTLDALKRHRSELLDPAIADNGGRIVKTTGDGLLLEYSSVVDAVACCCAVQLGMIARNAGLADDRAIRFRIGIHLGDVIVEGDDIFGDGVNIAARLQEIGEPDGVTVSAVVHDFLGEDAAAGFVDGGEHELKNIRRPIRVWRWSTAPVEVAEARLPLPDKPSIAVLPFDNMSGDPEQEYFADGITEDIITALSRFHWLFVTARNSCFVYKGKATDIRLVGRELGVRYVLEGSTRRAGKRVRITGQLIEAESGNHLWAERYDRDLDDVFALQDEITDHVAGALEPSLLSAEADRASQQKPSSLDAWGNVARALQCIWSLQDDKFTEAEGYLARAVGIDPHYAKAHSLTGLCQIMRVWMGWGRPDDAPQLIGNAGASAQTALRIDANDPWGHMVTGMVQAVTRDQPAAIHSLSRALDLNPNFLLARGFLALALIWAGRAEDSLACTEAAIRASPLDHTIAIWLSIRALAEFFQGRYRDSIETLMETGTMRTQVSATMRVVLASHAELGETAEARRTLDALLKLQPNLTLRWARQTLPMTDPDYMDRYIGALRKAGVPE